MANIISGKQNCFSLNWNSCMLQMQPSRYRMALSSQQTNTHIYTNLTVFVRLSFCFCFVFVFLHDSSIASMALLWGESWSATTSSMTQQQSTTPTWWPYTLPTPLYHRRRHCRHLFQTASRRTTSCSSRPRLSAKPSAEHLASVRDARGAALCGAVARPTHYWSGCWVVSSPPPPPPYLRAPTTTTAATWPCPLTTTTVTVTIATAMAYEWGPMKIHISIYLIIKSHTQNVCMI